MGIVKTGKRFYSAILKKLGARINRKSQIR